jgi:hypothetical protein
MGVDNITKASTMQEGGRFLPDRLGRYPDESLPIC